MMTLAQTWMRLLMPALALTAFTGCDRLDPLKESVSDHPSERNAARPSDAQPSASKEPTFRSPLDPPDTPDALRRLAGEGDPVGQYWMGQFHEYGIRGVAKDLNAALNFYKMAAEQGHEQSVIATERVEAKLKDPSKEAEDVAERQQADTIVLYIERIRKSAEAGRPESQYALGLYHEHGRYGVEQNISLAKEYYQRAAQQGFEKAMIALDRLSQQK